MARTSGLHSQFYTGYNTSVDCISLFSN